MDMIAVYREVSSSMTLQSVWAPDPTHGGDQQVQHGCRDLALSLVQQRGQQRRLA
jgi:hypothetical protein